jgi:outer membrane protein assembly factor BamA
MDGADTLRADRSFGGSQFSLGWKTPLVMDARLDAAISLYSTDYDDASMTDYGHWSLRAAVGRPWLNKRLESTLRLQFQSVSSESAEESMSFTRLDLGGQLDWRFRQGMELAARVDWQSWAGDREDGYLKTVLRLSQEF